MLPQIKLGLMFAKALHKHGRVVLHAANPEMLTRDLSDALRQQKHIITDPSLNPVETLAKALPVSGKAYAISKRLQQMLDIDSKGKSFDAILGEIIEKTEARGSTAADGIKEARTWTRDFLSNPEVAALFQFERAEIERPGSWKGIGKTALSMLSRNTQDISLLVGIIEQAKKPQPQLPKPDSPPQHGA